MINQKELQAILLQIYSFAPGLGKYSFKWNETPKNFKLKAATDSSGIFTFKGKTYYVFFKDSTEEIVVQNNGHPCSVVLFTCKPVILKSWFFTLALSHGGPGYVRVLAENYTDARVKMNNKFSTRWAFQYSSLEEVHPYDCILKDTIV